MRRALLTWSDRGIAGPRPGHHLERPTGDRGPVLRLLDESRHRYDAARVLTIPAGARPAEALLRELGGRIGDVALRVVPVDDPSDYSRLYRALGPLTEEIGRTFGDGWQLDVLLSAGTPQAQTLWVILVQAGLLRARMLQVIPPAFVPVPHPRAVREVRFDIEGFPEIRALRAEVRRWRAEARARSLPTMIGASEPMRRLAARVARVAATEVPVLVLGETGTGKELVARAIHDGGGRAGGPFVAENCAAFAEGILASELFGHEAGAFTGAAARRRGLFEQAHGGTLFLDEIGELAPRVQSHLLRVLQEGALRRVGGEQRVRVDVRVIAATHRDLAAMVRAGAFREDLYYRLRGATLELPPLRERPGDVPLLVEAFLEEARTTGAPPLSVTRDALRALGRHRWPGNVRELRAEVLRWGVFCDRTVDAGDLAPEIRGERAPRPPAEPIARTGVIPSLAEVVAEAEWRAITAALELHRGNLARTARALAIDRNTLKRKMRAANALARRW